MIVQLKISIKRLRNSWTSSRTVHLDPRSVPTRVYNVIMNKTTSNPYIAQVYAKGRDYVPTPAKMGEFPKTVHGRVFETEEEYREAIADMLNGM